LPQLHAAWRRKGATALSAPGQPRTTVDWPAIAALTKPVYGTRSASSAPSEADLGQKNWRSEKNFFCRPDRKNHPYRLVAERKTMPRGGALVDSVVVIAH
jgi:hypothetical protein